jgi:hypothetical protein
MTGETQLLGDGGGGAVASASVHVTSPTDMTIGGGGVHVCMLECNSTTESLNGAQSPPWSNSGRCSNSRSPSQDLNSGPPSRNPHE